MATPTVALTSLSIRDFRGIDRLDLDFRGPDGLPNQLVVLAGPNGSGKTAVLEAALIALGGSKMAVGPLGPRAVRRGGADFEIKAGFESEAVFGRDAFESRATSESWSGRLPLIPHWYFSSWRSASWVGPLAVRAGKGGRPPVENDKIRFKNIKQYLINVANQVKWEQALPALKSRYEDWMEIINKTWADFHPDSGGHFEVGLVDATRVETLPFDVFLVHPDRPRLEVDYLSAGQLELFLFIADLVLNDRNEGILLIDEPELHLDLEWHRTIIRTLMGLQPRVQLIVATHSPEIYDAARSYERHYLVPESDPRARLWPRVGARA